MLCPHACLVARKESHVCVKVQVKDRPRVPITVIRLHASLTWLQQTYKPGNPSSVGTANVAKSTAAPPKALDQGNAVCCLC